MTARASRAALGASAAALATWLAASRSPSPWLGLMAGVLGAALLLGAVWPHVVLRRSSPVVIAPPDAVATSPTRLVLDADSAAVQIRVVEPPSPWVGGRGEAEVSFPRRGVVHALRVQVRSAAPLGLVIWTTERTVQLAAPVAVAPREVPALAPPVTATAGRGVDAVVRGLRPYRRGDPQRLVHHAATARTGEVLVRELESPPTDGVVVVVDLAGPSEQAERAAERGAALARATLAAGHPTILVTGESGSVVADAVVTALDVGRRLARADATPVPAREAPDGALWVRGV